MKTKRYVLKNNRTGKDFPEFNTVVDVSLTDTHLIFEFVAENTKFFSYCEGYNSEIWKGDVCEAYICSDGSRVNYFEIQVAPNGSIYCSKVYNPDGNFRTTFIEENPVESAVEKIGNDIKVRFSIPLSVIGYDQENGLLINVFRIETEGGETDKNLLALNPTLCNTYHKPEFFVKF